MRSEFLDDLRDLPALAGVPIEAYVLAPLGREALREVIEQPATDERYAKDGVHTRNPNSCIRRRVSLMTLPGPPRLFIAVASPVARN
ncbi:MAG: hypothetical protein LC799_33245 [Actinobacteria bacterium]|nr:hypothetical protein [Actinomycetota bacterium]